MHVTKLFYLVLFSCVPLQFNNDDDFASNIQMNTPRYVRHFEDVADELLPPCTSTVYNGDIFDFLQVPKKL